MLVVVNESVPEVLVVKELTQLIIGRTLLFVLRVEIRLQSELKVLSLHSTLTMAADLAGEQVEVTVTESVRAVTTVTSPGEKP